MGRGIGLASLVIAIRIAYAAILLLFFDITIAEDYYDEIARNLVEGWGYVIVPGESPNLFRYPGYPYFLAALFRISDEPYGLVVGIQILLDLAALALIYLISRDIFGQRTGLLTVLVAAIYPFSMLYVVRYTTEPLFSFLLAATVLVLTRALLRGGSARFVVAGVLLGLAALCRASLFYFVFLLPLLAFVPFPRTRRIEHLLGLSIATIIAVLVMTPWGLRNLDVTGEFNLLGTAGGYSLWMGNNLLFDGRDRDELPPALERQFLVEERRVAGSGDLFTLESERRFKEATFRGWLEQPLASAWLILRKAFRFWFSVYKPENRSYAIILLPVQAGLLALSILGLVQAVRDRLGHWHLTALVLYLNALHALVTATFRYCVPVMPYVIMFAAYAIAVHFRRQAPRWTRVAPMSTISPADASARIPVAGKPDP